MALPRIQLEPGDSPSIETVLPSQADHPASVELDPSAQTLKETLHHLPEDPTPPTGKHRRLSAHRHRPHLHIRNQHRRSIDSTVSDSPRRGINEALLGVPRTFEPHPRSLDATPRTSPSWKTLSADKRAQRPRQGPADAKEDQVDDDIVSGKGYESPLTPDPVPIPDLSDTPPPPLKPVSPTPKANGQLQSVWDQVRYELDEKPGVTPTYLTPLLTHLQSLTRSHALKLSTASRTIEHRVAEWGILSDKLQEIDREAAEMGVSLVGKREWAAHLGDTPRAGGEEDADETPLKVLEQLVGATSKSSEALEALAQAVDARGNDVKRLKEKVEEDSVVLERRMGRGLERKMVSIERAQRDAKRRDLVINIVTFTVLFFLGIGMSIVLSKLYMLLPTGKWSFALTWAWICKRVKNVWGFLWGFVG